MIPYKNIFNSVALRAGLLADGSPATIEAAYSVNTNEAALTAKINSVEVPFSALKQDILAVEKELAELVANSNNSIYKAGLSSRSANLASGDTVPQLDENGKDFIGSITGIFDADTNRPLTETPKQQIYRAVQPESIRGYFTIPVYYYAFDGDTIITTTPQFYIKGTMWDEIAQNAAFTAIGNSPLPQIMENLWICKVLAGLAQETWFTGEAVFYANMANQKQQEFIEGRARAFALPQIAAKTANVAPGKD